MSSARLATGFWVAAKLRQIQNAGGYASILVKGHDEAGTINLILRMRDGTLKHAVPALVINNNGEERQFEWREDKLNDQALTQFIASELRFDRDQWFIECECSLEKFAETFHVK